MIIKVKDQIEREIEITFPCSFRYKDLGVYYYLKSENIGVAVYSNNNSIGFINASIVQFNDVIPCENIEVEAAFDRVIKHYKTNVFGITVDLNSNTPTEVLEKFERQSESVEMKHDFNK